MIIENCSARKPWPIEKPLDDEKFSSNQRTKIYGFTLIWLRARNANISARLPSDHAFINSVSNPICKTLPDPQKPD